MNLWRSCIISTKTIPDFVQLSKRFFKLCTFYSTLALSQWVLWVKLALSTLAIIIIIIHNPHIGFFKNFWEMKRDIFPPSTLAFANNQLLVSKHPKEMLSSFSHVSFCIRITAHSEKWKNDISYIFSFKEVREGKTFVIYFIGYDFKMPPSEQSEVRENCWKEISPKARLK